MPPPVGDCRSRAWIFVIRSATSPKLPEAFLPHTNFVSWVASPGPVFWTLRGYCQWLNPRNYATLKTRYCKSANWIPVDVRDVRIFEEYSIRPVPLSSYRYTLGIPFGQFPAQVTLPLPKVPLGIDIPDLIEDYMNVLLSRIVDDDVVEEPVRSTDDGLVTDDGLYWYDPLDVGIQDQKKRDLIDDKYHHFDERPLKRIKNKWTFFVD